MATVEAEPYAFEFDPRTTALVMIDFQRDFVYPGGFGEALGNDTSLLLKAVPPAERRCSRPAATPGSSSSTPVRATGRTCPICRRRRRSAATARSPSGMWGRWAGILVRGAYGHDIVEELYPIEGEPIVDKPGKGAFYATDLDAILKMKGIKQLVVCGVTTEVCVHTSVREANDRGYDALVLSDCVGSYFPEFQRVALEMIKAQGGIFGWVSDSGHFLKGLAAATGKTPAAAGAAVA